MNEVPVLPPTPRPSGSQSTHQRPTTSPPPVSTLPPVSTSRRPIDRRTVSLLRAFGYAFSGLGYLFRTQRNAQIHSLIAGCALALGLALRLARWEWVALVGIIALVLVAEGVNTAVEAVTDIATSDYHPLAGVAKDVAAGAVLLAALCSVMIGCLIFVPHLWAALQHWLV